jgi:hypothetical protein
MKKILLMLLLLLLSNGVYNSTINVIYIAKLAPIEPFKQLSLAIGMVESSCNTLAYNPIENAVGYYQIRPIRLKDYNNRTGNHYKMKDLYDYNVSKKIFLYYCDLIGPDIETISKRWNGTGPLTISYWNKVRKYLL